MSFVPFDPAHPFPLLSLEDYSYADAKVHARAVDAWLGLEIAQTEQNLLREPAPGPETWRGLDPDALLTPYLEIRLMLQLSNLQSGQLAIDLGCGYGRMGHVVHLHCPDSHFIGFEIEKARVLEGQKALQRWNSPLIRMQHQDLAATNFVLPMADLYLIYDFGSEAEIEKILSDLREISKQRRIQVIARGRRSRHQIHRDHPWLAEVNEPLHTPTFSIYRS